MSFKDFKKELARKKEQEETLRELQMAIDAHTKKRDAYMQQAKEALRAGNSSQYTAAVALLKYAIFNLKQAQDMLTNFTIAKDMYEMQQLNKKFVKSFNSVMKDVHKTSKSIRVNASEKNFVKALYRQNQTAMDLKAALESNNITFASSVSTISDVSDQEIRSILTAEIAADDAFMDSSLDELERRILGETQDSAPMITEPAKEGMLVGGGMAPTNTGSAPAVPSRPVETAPTQEAQKPTVAEQNKPSMPTGSNEDRKRPEDEILGTNSGFEFTWDNIPTIGFEDIAGLEEVKNAVHVKVLMPLKNPDAFKGYEKKSGGGLCLYGPPGTGKTMIAAAIAKEIGAKFCSVIPSDLLRQGAGNTERAVRTLFKEARSFPCAVIYFDEMDSISPKSTKSQYAKQLRSEFLAQLQGVESYGKDNGNVLFLVCATNKPWDIDSAFLRPGRFGTKVYVGLPDAPAREYMVNKVFKKIRTNGIVRIEDDVDVAKIVEETNGFNGSDITNLLAEIQDVSALRCASLGEKTITAEDVQVAFSKVHSSVQADDLIKLKEWREENDS